MKIVSAILAATLLVSAPALTPRAEAHGMVYADLADRVSPAVVNIFTTQAAPEAITSNMPDLPDGHPLKEFFERYAMPGARGNGEPERSLGSGFIFDPAGYVITNHHVIENADTIKVALSDDREFDARVIGSDKATDVALLKIESGFALPSVSFGDSRAVRVGEEVVAVGNAFGLGGTVTRGIVSAKGRDIRVGGPYVDYIQTDAAINRGNSGGPLFNMNGQVIGMNTAIYSPTGGSVGIGFAVPSEIVSRIITDLRDDGLVSRGWIGIGIQPVTDAIASALGLAEAKGTIVSTVSADGPSSGILRAGDVILTFNGQSLEKGRDLPRFVARTQTGSSVPVEIIRDGALQTIYLTVGTLKRKT
jgi:serine protease Do